MEMNLNAIDDIPAEELAIMLGSISLAEQQEIADEDENLDEDELSELEAGLARAEVYEAQSSVIDPTPMAPTNTPAAKLSKPARQTGSPVQRTPRKSLADLSDGVFQLYDSETPGPANKTATLAARPTQVKIAEKFDNLFLALEAGKAPSSYVVTALNVLSKTGTMTSADLIAAFKADDLKDGTARSQTGQIMELFNVVGIARRSGQSLTLRTDSVVARKLAAIINPTTALPA
jgi:hypothetical protein